MLSDSSWIPFFLLWPNEPAVLVLSYCITEYILLTTLVWMWCTKPQSVAVINQSCIIIFFFYVASKLPQNQPEQIFNISGVKVSGGSSSSSSYRRSFKVLHHFFCTVPLCIPYWLQRWGPAGLRGSWWRPSVVGFVVTAAVAPCPSHTGWGTSPPPCGPWGLHEPERTDCSYPGGPPVNGTWIWSGKQIASGSRIYFPLSGHWNYR